jgi:hypothetical protein
LTSKQRLSQGASRGQETPGELFKLKDLSGKKRLFQERPNLINLELDKFYPNQNFEYLMQKNFFFFLCVQKVFSHILYRIKRSVFHIYGFRKCELALAYTYNFKRSKNAKNAYF